MNGHALLRDFSHDILVIVLDRLELLRGSSVAIHNPVSAEITVMGLFPMVAAVKEDRFAIPVPGPDGLIQEIPDEAALIAHFLVGVFRILVHGPVGIAHGMGIFTKNERLFRLFFQVLTDFDHRRIHLAVDIRRFRIALIPGNALVVNRACSVQTMEQPADLQDHLSAHGLIAAAPDQDAGMVLVPLDHGIGPVQKNLLPFLPIPGQKFCLCDQAFLELLPYAVGFHVILINYIKTKLITQRIQRTLIGIMTGADRVNVVPLHGQQVTPEFVRGHCSAGFRTVIMPVHTLEDDAHSVELHDSVNNLKAPESDPDPGHLKYLTCRI